MTNILTCRTGWKSPEKAGPCFGRTRAHGIMTSGEHETIEFAVSPEDAKRIKGVKDLLDLSDELQRK